MSKFVLIITYGRSGSTLLMGILNSIPGFCIVGENWDSYKHLVSFYKGMRRVFEQCKDKEQVSTNPWLNRFSLEDLKHACRGCMSNIIDPSGDSGVVGFKEIRYPSHVSSNLGDYLDNLYFITDCKFVFLTRDLEDVCKSEWHRNNLNCEHDLKEFEDYVHKYIDEHSYQEWFHLTYEDMCKGHLKGLFEFLDVHEVNHEVLKAVLATPHSYKTTGVIKRSKI